MIDMTWGNPGFLQKYWEDQYDYRTNSDEGLTYNKECGLPKLKEAILDLHACYNNLAEGKWFVVVTNGATQAIQAAIYTLPGETVGASKPHYHKFPAHAVLATKEWDDSAMTADIRISTTPNNPDGSISLLRLRKQKHIADGCYNWPIYTNHVSQLNSDIVIYSLSKCTGHAGTRIGWALTRNPNYANTMRDFVEHQTCDVSQDAQARAYRAIQHVAYNPNVFMDYGKKVLEERWSFIKRMQVPTLNEQGMFLWSDNPKYFDKLNVQGIDGKEFGSPGHIRVNIGCTEFVWNQFVLAVTLYGEKNENHSQSARET